MSIDTRGYDAAGQVHRAAEWRSPVPPPAVLTRRRGRRALGRLAFSGAAVILIVALVWQHHPGDTPRLAEPGRVVATIPIGVSGFAGVAAGPDGVWVADEGQSVLLHVDPARNQVVGRVHYKGVLSDFWVGDGVVWAAVLNSATDMANARLLKIDPRSDKVTRTIPLRLHNASPFGVVAASGSLWLDDDGLVRVDEASGRSTTVLTNPPYSLGSLVAAGDRLWAIDGLEVVQINPATGKVVTETPNSDARLPSSLAVGNHTAWLVVEGGEIRRIDPGSGRVVARIRVGEGVWGVAAQGDTVAAISPGRLFLIDPRTNRVASSVELPTPADRSLPAVGAGAVWVAQPHGGGLLRIDPSLR
jgi:streptogramin lyase